METLRLVFSAAWEILWVGLLLGAGLPAVFAAGVRLLAGPAAPVAEDGTEVVPRPGLPQRVLAGVCFAVVLYGVAVGILIVVGGGMGKEVTFDHLIPALVPKS
ncbi:MAG: hypothetical protein QM714_12925 [Nocardioides sp.]|uniref:hypothetical protein n=1 Tax=Nocardioides sp. TaxID=35761 RepID=UPI0039E30607